MYCHVPHDNLQELIPCQGCPLGGPRVGNKGDPNSPVVIIGEGPGYQEVKHKPPMPFVGPSGILLDRTMHLAGLNGIEPYYINAMQCFPGKEAKDESILSAGVHSCHQRVHEELTRAPRKLIVALGGPAIWAVTGNHSLRITKTRGVLLPTPYAELGVLPTVHPAFLMRGGALATFQQYIRDLKYGAALLRGEPAKKPPTVSYEFMRDEKDMRELSSMMKALPPQTVVASDIETSGFSFLSNRMLCSGFAWSTDFVYGIPEHLHAPELYDDLFDNECRFLWHGGKFDVKFHHAAGNKRARIDEDTMMLSYSIDENGGIHDLEQVAQDWCGSPRWKDILDGYLPKKNTSYEVIPRHILHHYMALDIGNTLASFNAMRPIVAGDKHLNRLYTRTLIPASNFLGRVEFRGMNTDLERVSENEITYGAEVAKYRAEIMEWAKPYTDAGFTEKLVGSPKQLAKLIYDCVGIKPYKGQKKTGKDLIEKLPKHPLLESLAKYRKWAKEESTYVRPARDLRDKDNKVHTTLSLHGTRTGRLASKEPNVQNVPRNPRVRGQYVAGEGRRFVEPDLNQAELRILACNSNDKALCHIYETEGMSLHEEMRAFIWGTPKDWSTKDVQEYLRKFGIEESKRFGEKGEDRIVEEQKMRAKAVNFGIPYGRENFSIAEEFQIDPKEAQGWIDAWFRKFPDAHKFLQQARDAPAKAQVLITPFGNKRRFGVVGAERLKGMQNEASNFTCQAPASHCTLHAAMECEDELLELDAYVVNLVHDSQLWNCPDDDEICNTVAKRAIQTMEAIPAKWGYTRVPFVAEAKMGHRWGSLHKYVPK